MQLSITFGKREITDASNDIQKPKSKLLKKFSKFCIGKGASFKGIQRNKKNKKLVETWGFPNCIFRNE